MRTLAEGIEIDEAFAEHFARLTRLAAASEDRIGFVDAFASQARLHRVKAMQMRAQLGAMEKRYGARHLDGRDT